MRLSHYLIALVVVAAVGIYTVGLHVRRVEAGYRIRRLLDEEQELSRVRDRQRLLREREAATEKLALRARAMGILEAREAEGLAAEAAHDASSAGDAAGTASGGVRGGGSSSRSPARRTDSPEPRDARAGR